MISRTRDKTIKFASILLILAFALSACGGAVPNPETDASDNRALAAEESPSLTPTVQFELETGFSNGRMGFMGVGGSIDGIFNPTLQVAPGDVVELTREYLRLLDAELAAVGPPGGPE